MPVFINGLVLGLSLITALGPQNIFLIKQGAHKNHPVLSTTVCFLSDFILIFLSITSLHKLLERQPVLQTWLMILGCLFLLFYGIKALQRALSKNHSTTQPVKKTHNKFQVIGLALGFSLLNPHAIVDSLIIIGSGSSQFPEQRYTFLLGVVTSSFLWFSSLTFTAKYFSAMITKQAVWRKIELLSGFLMGTIGIKLGMQALL